jgi:hypothetical protein
MSSFEKTEWIDTLHTDLSGAGIGHKMDPPKVWRSFRCPAQI